MRNTVARLPLPAFFLILIMMVSTIVVIAQEGASVFFPAVVRLGKPVEPPTVEVRGIWVTRFDWTRFGGADPAIIDEIVDNVADAGLNVIFFQVRGAADAYYQPGLEPWASRLSGKLGQDPGWDPLARMVEKAHLRGLQVHAYVNVYPVWTGCEKPPDDTAPRHFYYDLLEAHGETEGKLNGLQWNADGVVACAVYQRASPASITADAHILAVVQDIVERYEIDGLHLDHIRYDGRSTSCDPVSEERYGARCAQDSAYADWQRKQVNGTVRKMYEQIVPLRPGLWLTAAVWPVYQDRWGWGVNGGYDTYYQDSKAWVNDEYIAGITPMIYTDVPDCDRPYFWTRARWQTLVEDFQADSNGRFIVPGIGTSYCTDDDFGEIEARINMARSIGTSGHSIFSYRSLLDKGYFDDLAAGPYASPATVPDIPWHP